MRARIYILFAFIGYFLFSYFNFALRAIIADSILQVIINEEPAGISKQNFANAPEPLLLSRIMVEMRSRVERKPTKYVTSSDKVTREHGFRYFSSISA